MARGGAPASHGSMGNHGHGGAHHAYHGPGVGLDVRVRSGCLSPFCSAPMPGQRIAYQHPGRHPG